MLDLTTAKMQAFGDKSIEAPSRDDGTPFSGTSCAYCEHRLPVGRVVKFCPFCGRDIRVVSCPSCGADLEAGWRYCVDCGAPPGT